jgi:hypothetical protein
MGSGEVSDPFRGGSVASNVGCEPLVFEDLTCLEEGAEIGLGCVHKVPEPFRQGFLGVGVVVQRGSVSGGVEGAEVHRVLRVSHRALCCCRVHRAYLDISGLGSEASVKDIKVRESSSISDETRGSRWSLNDWSGGGSVSESCDFCP